VAALAVAAPALAQETVAITGGRVLTGTSVIENGTVVLRDGKIVSVGVMLVTVPLTLHYLGPERYGMWLIMSSFIGMLSFADLGIGNGVLNAVAAAHGRDDSAALREAISSGLVALLGIALVLAAAFAIAWPHIAWERLFNVTNPGAVAEAAPAMAVFAVCFLLAIPLGVVQRVQTGLQQGFVANLWQGAGSILSLVGVLAAIGAQAGLPWLVLAFMGGPVLASVANTISYFVRSPAITPSRHAVKRGAMREVVQTGALFLVLQLAAAIAYNVAPLVIAQTLGAAAVPQYSVPERLFALISMIVSMALQPLWPAYREAIMRGDSAWVRRTLKLSLKVATGVAAAMALPLVLLFPTILHLWVGSALAPPLALIIGLGVWKVIEAAGTALAMFLNGAQVVKVQVICSVVNAILCAGGIALLIGKFGISVVPWTTALAYTVSALLPYAIIMPNLIAKSGERSKGRN